MHSSVTLIAGPGRPGTNWTMEHVESTPPYAWRQAGPAAFLVGTAAGPVDDDQVDIGLRVRSGARLEVRTNAATVIWAARRGTGQRIDALVEAGAELTWVPEPAILTGRAHHRHEAVVAVEGDGRLLWREIIVLGRHCEIPGRVHSYLRISVDGRPLLVQSLDLGGPSGVWNGPTVIGTGRVLGFAVIAGSALPHVIAEAGSGWSVMPLDGPGSAAVAIGSTVGEVAARLAVLGLYNRK